MSYYFVKMGINSRSSGGSALRRSAYQRCAKDPDFDFSRKANELVDADVMLPEGADPTFEDPVALWSSVESKENRINSQLCRTFEISIPNEVPAELRSEFARELLQPFVDHGLPVEWAIHQEEAIFQAVENPHISAAIGFRQLGPAGWAKNKDRIMNTVMRDDAHGKFWVPAMNAFFEKHGIDARVEHKSQHMPEASRAVRRIAKEWKQNGADPNQIPGPVAKFIAHREAHLEILKQEIDMKTEIELLTAEIETLEKEIGTISEPETIAQEIPDDGSQQLPGSDTTERTASRRDHRSGSEEDHARDDEGDQSREDWIAAISLETESAEVIERSIRSNRNGSGQERGNLRATESATDRRGLRAGRKSGTDRYVSRNVRSPTGSDRSQVGDIQRRLTPLTLAEKIRRDDAARPTNDRLKRLEQRQMRQSVTPAKPLRLLEKIRISDIVHRLMKRLDTLERKITSRQQSTTLAQKIMRRDAGYRMNQRLDILEKNTGIKSSKILTDAYRSAYRYP